MDYIGFLDRIGLCEEAAAMFMRLHSRTADPVFCALVRDGYEAYDASDEAFAAFLERFAAWEKVTVEEANLYLYLHMCQRTYQFYQDKGIEDDVFYATMKGFAFVCNKCHGKTGIYGIEQKVYRAWYRRHLNGTLFRLGRLEFEIIKSSYDFAFDGVSVSKGDTCISVHIPAGDALDFEESETAYGLARVFFAERFNISPCIFFCGSWLLHPWLSEDLPAGSRIVQFQKQFYLAEVLQDELIVRDWLFDNSTAPFDQLPVKTSLHKAAVCRLQKGLPIGQARGYRL